MQGENSMKKLLNFCRGGAIANLSILAMLALFAAGCNNSSNTPYIPPYIPPVAQTYTVTVATGIENGTVAVDKTTAAAGATITLTATPASGYILYEYVVKTASGSPVQVSNNQFTMPASNVTVSATFKQLVDLSTITSDTTIPDGYIVIGTLANSVKISIAAGATVTLKNVSINADGSLASADHAGLVCEGDATIVLADGSTNDVKGFMDGPSGVHVLPGFTLTINGSTGVLNASTKGGGAGIGSGYNGGQRAGGNIVINGGVINATGGNLGAGIGSGGRSTIGNITINGGTITAVGGGHSAGIGCGDTNKSGSTLAGVSQCGDITIANTVTKVTATKGSGAAHSIGKGNNSGDAVCGTVTIGGTEGYISDSPYTYQP